MNLGSPNRIMIKPDAAKTEFLFQLTFPERQQPVEFSISAEGAMVVMSVLQRLQAKHEIPIPKASRPSGPPILRVVTNDE
jgi:hypothetical protein